VREVLCEVSVGRARGSMFLKEISQSDLPRELVLNLWKRRYAESAVSEKRSKQQSRPDAAYKSVPVS
jgi:hypothetical protein